MGVISNGTTLIDAGALDSAVASGPLQLISSQTASSSANISFTSGTFFKSDSLFKIDAARIGKVAFFEPETFMTPLKVFFPLIINFCIKN